MFNSFHLEPPLFGWLRVTIHNQGALPHRPGRSLSWPRAVPKVAGKWMVTDGGNQAWLVQVAGYGGTEGEWI